MNSEPKRTLIISPSMDKGGAETFIMKVYREMDKSKYQFDFYLMCDYKSAYEDEIKSLGGNVFHGTKKTDSYIKYKKDMKFFFSEHHYETIYRAGDNSLTSLDLKFSIKYGKPNRTIFRATNARPPKLGLKDILHYLYRPIANKNSDIKLSPSTLAAEFVFGKHLTINKKVNIIHNGLDFNLFKFNYKKRIEKRLELGIQENDKVIVHVGRFAKQKNHLFIIDVFNELLKKDNNYKLIFVGEKNQLYEEVYKKATTSPNPDKFIFLGSRDDVPELLMAADALLFPSFHEGMPNVVIEAQATGLPSLISSNITSDVKITKNVYFLSLNDNSLAWATSINNILLTRNLEKRKEFSNSFPENYFIENVTKNIIEIFFE